MVDITLGTTRFALIGQDLRRQYALALLFSL